MSIPQLVGMIHLAPLPGSADFDGDFDAVITAATSDAELLAEAGFDGIMIENFRDAPFFASDVPKVTIASVTTAVHAVYEASRLPIGVNVLRNDGLGALSVAAATPASFVRINVLSGTMFTDQGPIVGQAAEVARLRSQICPEVSIMADVYVKHATPPAGLSLTDATKDLVERAGADAVIVSGSGTGSPVDLEQLTVVAGITHLPVYLGSGATVDNVEAMFGIADGAIVGTSIKVDGVSTNPVDLEAAAAFVQAARERLSR
ncbi:MAG: BtpA/SgcQ family protein [Acidimicrobiia bacterium]|nr:MAG: BtpA/SgcQ family protein [Acidimicrobiia bacterium]